MYELNHACFKYVNSYVRKMYVKYVKDLDLFHLCIAS